MKQFNNFLKSCILLLVVGTCIKANAQSAIQGTWFTKAAQYASNIGQRYTFNFPPQGFTSMIWGTGIYTTDCSIGSAAVHAGLITKEAGGTVTIEIRPGQTSYEGSVYNGVTSFNWGTFGSSFIFINEHHQRRTRPVMQYLDWSTTATEYSSNIGQSFSFYIPANVIVTGAVWGTGIYTTDCSIAAAAVHAGMISPEQGGIVTIEIMPGQNSYKGSLRNGVSSSSWGSFGSSFRFVKQKANRRR